MRHATVAVVLPAYNEAENIIPMVEDVINYLNQSSLPGKVIVVNDGSSDGTYDRLEQLTLRYPDHVIGIHHRNADGKIQNYGYGAAVRTGLKAALEAEMEYIFFTDADRQFHIDDLDLLFAMASEKQIPIVVGYRKHRADPFYRKVNALGWKAACALVLGFWVKDLDCAFKLIKRDVLVSIGELQGEGAAINPEIFAKALRMGYQFAEVGVRHRPRPAGKQTGANIKVILRSFRSLTEIKRQAASLPKKDKALQRV